MNRFEILAALKAHGLSADTLRRAGHLDEFVRTLEVAFSGKDNEIGELKRRLQKREGRQLQKRNAKPGRSRGRPSIYDSSGDYFNYWSMRWLMEIPPSVSRADWLDTIELNRDGKPLRAGERKHIKKILTTMLPDYVKEMRRSKSTVPDMFSHLNTIHSPDCTGCPTCAED